MRKIFIDCGAHDGCSIRKFRGAYMNASKYEIYSFEPNPALAKFHPVSEDVKFFQKAVWIEDGQKTFYQVSKDKYGKTDALTGASTLDEAKARYNISRLNHQEHTKLVVETVDLSNWIMEEFSKEDYIVLKLDVEGSEYAILDKMIADGSIKYIDHLFAEFHNIKCGKTLDQDEKIISVLRELQIPYEEWDALGYSYQAQAHINRKV